MGYVMFFYNRKSGPIPVRVAMGISLALAFLWAASIVGQGLEYDHYLFSKDHANCKMFAGGDEIQPGSRLFCVQTKAKFSFSILLA